MREHNIQNIAHLSYYTNANGLLLVVLIKRGSANISLSPWRGGGGPPLLRAPTVAKHLVSAPPTSCHVSSPRLHARVASRAAPALAPPLPHHTRPPLSSARHLLPLPLSRRRGLKTVDFWGRRKVRPRALPQPRPRSPFEQPYGHCG